MASRVRPAWVSFFFFFCEWWARLGAQAYFSVPGSGQSAWLRLLAVSRACSYLMNVVALTGWVWTGAASLASHVRVPSAHT
jgi:hypothetical protein